MGLFKENKLEKDIDYNKIYTQEVQKLFVDYMVSDQIFFSICQNIISPEYFDITLDKSVTFILDYAQTYRAPPSAEVVKANTGLDVNKIDDHSQRDYFLNAIESFCKWKALESVLMKGARLLSSGNGAEIEELVKKANEISLQSDLGLDYFNNPRDRLQSALEGENYISSGWTALDEKLGGGIIPGTLNMWCGGPGCVTGDTKIKVIKLLKI